MLERDAGDLQRGVDSGMVEEYLIESPAAMRALGERLAKELQAGDTLLVNGDLGAGKTTLAQGIAYGLGITEAVTSPTFTLVAEHLIPSHDNGIGKLYHLDLYRLDDPGDLESIGYDDYLSPADGVSLIEWPERAGGWLPDHAYVIEIAYAGPDRRMVQIRKLQHDSGPGTPPLS
jgi:tRNA threonylcarbamoyladenosine biosynthesis protein TsaE